MRKFYSITILFFSLIALAACSSSSDSTDVPTTPTGIDDDDPEIVPSPDSASLVFPEDNTECNEGQAINDTQSTVTFLWNASENTDSYTVTLTNLNAGDSFNTVANENEAPITILRGTPYEWYVTSSANGTTVTAQSATFRFYNEGPGVENYAPFPALGLYPSQDAILASNTQSISLEWAASDVDNDIANYQVFFGLEGQSVAQSTTTDTSFVVTVASGNTYEWHIVVTDSQNNASTSKKFHFSVE